METFTIDAKDTIALAELAPIISGKPDITKITEIDLEKLGREFRLQKVIFQASAQIFDLVLLHNDPTLPVHRPSLSMLEVGLDAEPLRIR